MVYIKQVEKPSDSSKIEVMESQKLPFEITPTIKRYLEDIVYLREEWLADKDILYMIEEEIPGEVSTPKRWGNNKNFWEYLEKQKAVKDLYGFGIESLTKIIGKNHPIQQIAIARTHGNEKSPVEKFWAQSKTWKKDLEKIAKLSVECSLGDIYVKPYILLKIFDFKPIEELLEKIGGSGSKEIIGTKKNFDELEVTFDDNKANIRVGNSVCQLPPYKNEHFFCRVMFEYQANEPADWMDCYEKMTGYYEIYFGKPKDSKENWHMVYDAMQALNERIKKVAKINEDLFIWNEKTIKRVK